MTTSDKRSADEIFYTALKQGHLERVKYFIEELGLNPNISIRKFKDLGSKVPILILAMSHNQTDVAEYLIKSGADPNIRFGSSKTTPLTLQAFRGKLEMVKMLHENGADLNKKSGAPGESTPLSLAIKENNTEVVEYLKKHGAKRTF